MGVPSEAERCPQCSHEGYRYDAVCRVWCCGQCHTTETMAEKGERDERATPLRAATGEGRRGF